MNENYKRYMQARIANDDVDYMFLSEERLVAMHTRAGRSIVLVQDYFNGTGPYVFVDRDRDRAEKICSQYVDEIVGSK